MPCRQVPQRARNYMLRQVIAHFAFVPFGSAGRLWAISLASPRDGIKRSGCSSPDRTIAAGDTRHRNPETR